MSKLIIFCGLPGSGKTTLAEAVSRKLNIVCLHKDFIKEKLYDIRGLSTLEDSKKLGREVMELLFALAKEQVTRGVDVAIEAPFNFPEDYAQFERWQKDYGVKIYSVICTIDEKERYRRCMARIGGDRHRSHHDSERMVNFSQFKNDYDYATIPGLQLRLTTNKPIEELTKQVVKHILQ